jgi:hypothetical protein
LPFEIVPPRRVMEAICSPTPPSQELAGSADFIVLVRNASALVVTLPTDSAPAPRRRSHGLFNIVIGRSSREVHNSNQIHNGVCGNSQYEITHLTSRSDTTMTARAVG